MQPTARLATIIHLCSFLVLLYSLSMFGPILMGLVFVEADLSSFIITLAGSSTIGLAGWLSTRNADKNLRTRDGFMVAVLFWITVSIISALPFLLDKRLDLRIVDAVFEGVSGITTTGASILNDIDNQPKSILYYRAQLNFLGGLGIIVLAIAVLPLLGIGGAKLYQSELPGPFKEEKLTPRLADTAKHLWLIYTGLGLACGIAYFLAGMDWFEALCHALSTVSLGGFSPHGDSLGFYDNPAIELVGGIFSILAAINFALYFAAISKVSLMPILRNSEFQFFILMVTLVVGFTCLELYRTGTFDAQGSAVHGFFQAISIMTDNGLGAGGYPSWPAHIVLLLLGASFFGGCVGSTCGGIKAMRFLMLHRQSSTEIKKLIHPNATFVTKVGGNPVSDRMIQSVWGLFFLWIFFACVFVWGLVASGHDFVTAFGTVAACINNMGVGYGDTSSGFGTLTDPGKWLMAVAMLFGRIEIFPILVILSKTFRRF
ncbi:potassium transporter [Marinobacterium sp. D7]|uniref:TrkH family potassium uptake protein n=1 Tax=Marinobacterium ramblicola TaxID=2849041 RepID=UPI001C2D770B|nr:potassium transporter TrkG [Marinobacterium ramblicola]MBV1788435.1 potassium transporter [Marinobacterium ramblicola]